MCVCVCVCVCVCARKCLWPGIQIYYGYIYIFICLQYIFMRFYILMCNAHLQVYTTIYFKYSSYIYIYIYIYIYRERANSNHRQ